MKQTLLAALHLIGAVIFLVFMIARTAQATDGGLGLGSAMQDHRNTPVQALQGPKQ